MLSGRLLSTRALRLLPIAVLLVSILSSCAPTAAPAATPAEKPASASPAKPAEKPAAPIAKSHQDPTPGFLTWAAFSYSEMLYGEEAVHLVKSQNPHQMGDPRPKEGFRFASTSLWATNNSSSVQRLSLGGSGVRMQLSDANGGLHEARVVSQNDIFRRQGTVAWLVPKASIQVVVFGEVPERRTATSIQLAPGRPSNTSESTLTRTFRSGEGIPSGLFPAGYLPDLRTTAQHSCPGQRTIVASSELRGSKIYVRFQEQNDYSQTTQTGSTAVFVADRNGSMVYGTYGFDYPGFKATPGKMTQIPPDQRNEVVIEIDAPSANLKVGPAPPYLVVLGYSATYNNRNIGCDAEMPMLVVR